MIKKSKSIVSIVIIIVLSGAIIYFSNLYWLAQHDKPSIRGNHVGLTFLCVITFWGLLILIKRTVIKKNKADSGTHQK